MKLASVLIAGACAWMLAACNHDDAPAETPADASPAAVQVHGAQVQPATAAPTPGTQDVDADVATPRTVYKQAIDHARKTLTIDSAKQRLEDMDAQIEQEKEMAQ